MSLLQPILKSLRRSDATFYPSGRIDIGANIVRVLNLHPKDVIGLSYDEENNILIYRRLTADERLYTCRYAGTLFSSHIGQVSLRANVVQFCRHLLDHFHDSKPPLRFSMGDVVEYPVIGTCVNLVIIK